MSIAEERMQNEIDELEQENRLLRARNERLEGESEMRRLALLDTLKETPVQEPDLAKSYREELDKLSQRNYELRMENAELKNTPSAAQRQWVGLTDEDRVEIYEEHRLQIRPIIEIVEAKLKEKNA